MWRSARDPCRWRRVLVPTAPGLPCFLTCIVHRSCAPAIAVSRRFDTGLGKALQEALEELKSVPSTQHVPSPQLVPVCYQLARQSLTRQVVDRQGEWKCR